MLPRRLTFNPIFNSHDGSHVAVLILFSRLLSSSWNLASSFRITKIIADKPRKMTPIGNATFNSGRIGSLVKVTYMPTASNTAPAASSIFDNRIIPASIDWTFLPSAGFKGHTLQWISAGSAAAISEVFFIVPGSSFGFRDLSRFAWS